ncbi:MAG: hypothetical protein HZB99_04365 [Candidatus Harrisonbacteria bacterium]|nr:hypothetical protein [Candidatus Harrisonbacteria bacterium]
MYKLHHKLLGVIILISIIFTPISSSFTTNKANAIVGIADVTFVTLTSTTDPITLGYFKVTTGLNVKALAAQGITAVSTKTRLLKTIMEFALKIAGQTLKKAVLDRLVDAIVKYISGQTDVIIEDWDQFFQDAAEFAAGEAAAKFAGGFLCNKFDLNIRIGLLPVETFSKKQACTLQNVVDNIDSFVENFEDGGWIAYQETLTPQNNFYGAMLSAMDEMAEKRARGKDAAKSEGETGGGFKSQRGADGKGIVTPGNYIAQTIFEGVSPKKDILGVLTADDIAGYMAAIVNAGVNRLTRMGIDGLKGMLKSKKTTKDYTTTTTTNPCAGLTGDAFAACRGFQNSSATFFQFDKKTVQAEFDAAKKPREEAQTILDRLVIDQTEIVNTYESLAICKSDNPAVRSQLEEERSILEELENKRSENAFFLDSLEESGGGTQNVGANDWAGLSESIFDAQQLSDATLEANDFLDTIKAQQVEINQKIITVLPGIQEQLRDCPFLSS